MRHHADDTAEGGFDEATTGFIDIQFGLIAILILALSAATVGFLSTARRLELTEASARAFAYLLRYESPSQAATSPPTEADLHRANTFGGLALYPVSAEGVVVFGAEQDSVSEGDALFRTGFSEIQENNGGRILALLRTRTAAFFPCFAPLDRSLNFNNSEEKREFNQRIDACENVYLRASGIAPIALHTETLNSRDQPGLDLFVIEGHSDGQQPNVKNAAVAEARAQRVLYALLSDEQIGLINDISEAALPYRIDGMARQLPGQGRSGYRSALLDLVPLSTRIFQECLAEYKRAAGQISHTKWCDALLRDAGALREASEGIVAGFQLRVPRIFALSSYGRFSLRFGRLAMPNNRDRRVEFRFRPAAIPPSIHELVRAEGGNQSYYRLYSASAALTLHRCDLQRPVDGTCVGALNDLVEKGYNARTVDLESTSR